MGFGSDESRCEWKDLGLRLWYVSYAFSSLLSLVLVNRFCQFDLVDELTL